MRTLLVLFLALGSLLRPAFGQADTTPPTCKIVASIISGSPGGGTTHFTYYIKAADETALRSPYAIEYRARVNNISNDQAGFDAWAPYTDGADQPLTITVQCTSFQFEVRAVDEAGNRSPAEVRRYQAPFPITPVISPRFSAAQKLLTGGTTVNRVVAKFDFDGDGNNDVVTGDHETGVLKIRRNTEGDGKTFTDLDVPFFENSLDMAAGGLLTNKAGGTTNDALPDLVVANNGQISVMTNQGVTGDVLSFAKTDLAVTADSGYYTQYVAVGDLNDDGFDDIVSTATPFGAGQNSIAVFLNLNGSTGGFATPVLISSGLTGFLYNIQVADLNGDGYADVVLAGRVGQQNKVEVYTSDSEGHLSLDGSYDLGGYTRGLALGDVTSDGYPEIVVGEVRFDQNGLAWGVEVLRNQGDATFVPSLQFPVATGEFSNAAFNFPCSVAVGDANLDGEADIVAGCEASKIGKIFTLKTLKDPGDSSFFASLLTRSVIFIAGGPIRALAFDDLDGDGKRDIFTATDLAAKPAGVLLNLTLGGVTAPTSFKFSVTGDTKPLDGFISGWDFNFSTVLASTATGLKLRVQSTLDPANEGSWTDLPGGGYMIKSGVNKWNLVATSIPPGMRYFRVIASSNDFADQITKDVGPFNIKTPVYLLDMRVAEVVDTTPKVRTSDFKRSYTLKVERGSTGLLAVKVTNTGSLDKFTVKIPRSAMGEHFRTLAATDVTFDPYVTPAAPADTFVTIETPYIHHLDSYTFYLKSRVAVATPEGELGGFDLTGTPNADGTTHDTVTAVIKASNPKNSFFVTNTNDSGTGSLRQAIFNLSAQILKPKNPAPDIKFEIPTTDPNYNSGVPTITLQSSLLPIALHNVAIDGNTQTDYQRFSGTTEGIVVLRGDSYDAHLAHPHTPHVSIGLDIFSSGCRIEHLAFYDMETALRLNGKSATGNVIRGCSFLANVEAGVLIEAGAHKNIVGGTEAADRNYFMAQNAAFTVTFGSFGVEIRGDGSDGNLVQGNLIGEGLENLANVFGGASVGMADAGVCIKGDAQGNLVGGRSSKERNFIVRNGTGADFSVLDFGGISISGAHTDGNLVQGNYIGVDELGTTAVGNELGIQIRDGAQNNLIGGTDPGAGNVISGNNYNGLSLNDEGTAHNRIVGNIIGLDALGDTAVPNGDNGIALDNAHDNIIGGTTADSRNIISGNAHDAVHIVAHRNVIQGNYIGTDITGQFARANGKAGVYILGGDDNVIGFNGKSTGANIIAFNTGFGVEIDTAKLSGSQDLTGYRNSIRGNSIFGNGKIGIDLKVDPDNGGVETSDGVNFNGTAKATDANEGLNHPDIQTAAVVTGGGGAKTTNVVVKFNSAAVNTNFAFDFYASDVADPSGFGEGAQSLGYLERKTDANGNLTFTGIIKGDYSGKVITATATRKNGADFGSTSEFSGATNVTN
ncbi:MAG: hypothetical protein QOD99_3166 [Chthoniobacter sp.]|jgi:hypothetical protein|nr:hypothetical protein [Chthoniobacter sp.]